MSKKKKTRIALFIVMGVAVLGLGVAVYAKYFASFTANGGNLTVAKWAFKSENQPKTVTCNMADTYDVNTLANGKIAPGTAGSCSFQLTNEQSDVAVDYTIKPSSDLSSNAPANLVLKSNGSTIPTTGLTGTINAHDATGVTVTIDWEWPYYTSDANDGKDNTDGESPKTMTLSFDVSGIQKEP